MKSFSRIALTLIVGSLPILAGCTTTSDAAKKKTVTIKKGNFESGEAGLGNDIQSILAQGGLNTSDPAAAPPSPATDNQIKTLSTTATDLQTLVAQLDAKGANQVDQPSSQAKAAPVTASTTALALAEQPKASGGQTQIAEAVQTTTFAPIGTPGELIPITMPTVEPVKEVPKAVVETRKRQTPKAARVVPPQLETSYKKPTVKRF
jgi:hypothetical protein